MSLVAFAYSCASSSSKTAKKPISPLDAVTIEGCAANWSDACERAIQAPPPEPEETQREVPKKKKFKKPKKTDTSAIKMDELFEGDVELAIPDNLIDSDTQWDGAFGE
jgi:hypothetical protein